MRLYGAQEVRDRAGELPELKVALDWAEAYLMHPHPEMGRPGAVCPYVRGAIDHATLWFARVRTPVATEEAVADGLRAFREPFGALEPRSRTGKVQKALMLTFPDLTEEQACALLSGVARRVKQEFVEDGLITGPTYRGNPTPSAHSAFPSMESPVPLVTIRMLVDTDLNFMNRPYDPPAVRAKFVADFLRHVGPELSDARRAAAESALAELTGSPA